ETDASGATLATYAYDDRGALHSTVRDGATYYYHANHRGDVVAMTDVDGEVVNAYAYDPYGEVTHAEESVPNPYRYAGYRYDDTTGLYYLWNRYYDPDTCRFLTRDPYPGELDEPMSMNPYLYCLGDPVNHVDPDGLEFLTVCAILAVTGTVAAVVLLVAYVAGGGSVRDREAQELRDAVERTDSGVEEAVIRHNQRSRELVADQICDVQDAANRSKMPGEAGYEVIGQVIARELIPTEPVAPQYVPRRGGGGGGGAAR
ncbi:MAG: hypothetical protein IBX63_10565, partial [Coriobacteriia bacterium]|nr:hypothetical protein [Coriobacteriia bacterium]